MTEMLVQSSVRISPGKPTLTRHPAFFPAMSALLIVCVFLGFAPTYYMRPANAGPIPAYLQVHGAAMTGWYVLLLLQTTLIAMRRRAVHRRLGIAGAVIAAVIVLLNPMVVVWSVGHRAPGTPIELTALIVVADLLVVAIFAILVMLAIRWRRYPETHSRMMMLASIAVAGPALGRFSLNLAGTPLPGIIALMLLPLLVVAHDRLRMNRVHSVSAWGTAAIIGSLVLSIAIANSPAGRAIVRWLE
jgi:hypothetical protein